MELPVTLTKQKMPLVPRTARRPLRRRKHNGSLQSSVEDPTNEKMDGSKFPPEIYGEILSFLPMFPFYFSLARVCKSWKEEIDAMMEDNQYEQNQVIHFGYEKPDDKFVNKIVDRCRNAKTAILHQKAITTTLIDALGKSKIETLILHKCSIAYGADINLELGQFQNLKRIILLEMTSNLSIRQNFTTTLADFNPNIADLTQLTIPKENYVHKPSFYYHDDAPSRTALLNFDNRDPIMVILVSLNPHTSIWLSLSRSYSSRVQPSIIESANLWVRILKDCHLWGCVDRNQIARQSGLQMFKEFVEMDVVELFDDDSLNHPLLLGVKTILTRIPLLSAATKRGQNFRWWIGLDITQNVLNFIEWIHTTLSSEKINQDSITFKSILTILQNIDKKWNEYFIYTSFEPMDETFVEWSHFLLTGERIATKKRKSKGSSSRKSKRTK